MEFWLVLYCDYLCMKNISVVIICKNESSCIAECLESVKLSDEVIVCDTWSTDNTVEIAKRFTDKIYHFEWCDDFSAARNYAKQFATNDWILSIDCDEVLITENWIQPLRDMIDTHGDSIDAIKLDMWNWANMHWNAIRLFKKELDWKWSIHEVIDSQNSITSNACIRYWRSSSHDLDPDLDLRIMQKEHEKDPTNTRVMFYLAREYY